MLTISLALHAQRGVHLHAPDGSLLAAVAVVLLLGAVLLARRARDRQAP